MDGAGTTVQKSRAMLSRQRDLAELQGQLTRWLTTKLPAADGLAVSPPVAPSAGFSNETLLVDLSHGAGAAARVEPLVVRLPPTEFAVFPEYDLARQCRVMQSLAGSDLPVPRVRWLEEDEGVVGCKFFVMDRIAGEIPPDIPSYQSVGVFADAPEGARATMWWRGLETLARIHGVDWQARGLGFLGVPPAGTGPLDRQLDYYQHFLGWIGGDTSQPILQAALGWLRAHRYTPARIALCWGDARLPNLIYRDGAVVGVLDWEMAFLGDPEADLGWWLFMDWHHSEGYGVPRLDGLPSRQETIARYEELAGRRVAHPLWQEVFAAVRFGIILVKVTRNIATAGFPPPAPDFETNNICTRRLAELLELPPPG